MKDTVAVRVPIVEAYINTGSIKETRKVCGRKFLGKGLTAKRAIEALVKKWRTMGSVANAPKRRPPPPDLTTCDYFLWGHLKSTVYKSNLHTIQELKDNISHAVAAIKITILCRVYLIMIRRAQLCIDAGGNHLHHLLWWFSLSALGYCINFCIYTMQWTRATFSWPTLYVQEWL